MIGNDVVDLLDPETQPGATHPRFDARVFAPEELRLLARRGAAPRWRWALWAAKEAAWKAARKLEPRLPFSPRRFVVDLDGEDRGCVRHPEGRLHLRLRREGECVHALASETPLEAAGLVTGCITLAADDPRAGQVVRAAARDALAARLGVEPEELSFTREGRVPRLRLHGGPAPLDVSLSHHGRFAAFAAVPLRAAAGSSA